ncbi:MAG: hypothetical protein EPO21_17845 [Chloroflexota bacterium]|nr:MAG: hypothetical protein EPO21_17845 [Chloroflexota bacterium]
MYILSILLMALIVYALIVVLLRLFRRQARLALMSTASFAAFVVLLAAFNGLSLVIGIDLGPGHAVSYSIPDDYTARGTLGIITLAVAALASLSPVFGLGVALRRQQ